MNRKVDYAPHISPICLPPKVSNYVFFQFALNVYTTPPNDITFFAEVEVKISSWILDIFIIVIGYLDTNLKLQTNMCLFNPENVKLVKKLMNI